MGSPGRSGPVGRRLISVDNRCQAVFDLDLEGFVVFIAREATGCMHRMFCQSNVQPCPVRITLVCQDQRDVDMLHRAVLQPFVDAREELVYLPAPSVLGESVEQLRRRRCVRVSARFCRSPSRARAWPRFGSTPCRNRLDVTAKPFPDVEFALGMLHWRMMHLSMAESRGNPDHQIMQRLDQAMQQPMGCLGRGRKSGGGSIVAHRNSGAALLGFAPKSHATEIPQALTFSIDERPKTAHHCPCARQRKDDPILCWIPHLWDAGGLDSGGEIQ